MRNLIISTVATFALANVAAVAEYVYGGFWRHQFDEISGVAVSPVNGNVYVVDHDLHRVQYFTSNGSFLGKWGDEGEGDGQFYHPEHVAVASGGRVYVVDAGNDRIQYFTPTGSFVRKWGDDGTGPGEFRWPFGVAVAPNRRVYVTDQAPFTNYALDRAWDYTHNFIWYANYATRWVVGMTPAGSVRESWQLKSTVSYPYGVAYHAGRL